MGGYSDGSGLAALSAAGGGAGAGLAFLGLGFWLAGMWRISVLLDEVKDAVMRWVVEFQI